MHVTYKLTEKDIELLRDYRPSPCADCSTSASYACTGCPKYYDWIEKYNKPIEAAGLKDIADEYVSILKKKEQQKELQFELTRLEREIHKDSHNFVDKFYQENIQVQLKQLLGIPDKDTETGTLDDMLSRYKSAYK